MKKLFYFLFSTLLFSSCLFNNDNEDTLPPATQTGEGTFTCLVNGEPFIDASGGYFNCFYQLIDGEYFFGILGKDQVGSISGIVTSTTNKSIAEGETLILKDNIDGNAWGVLRSLLVLAMWKMYIPI